MLLKATELRMHFHAARTFFLTHRVKRVKVKPTFKDGSLRTLCI